MVDKKIIILLVNLLLFCRGFSQTNVPLVYSNIDFDSTLHLKVDSIKLSLNCDTNNISRSDVSALFKTTKDGIELELQKKISGRLYYGLLDVKSNFPIPLYCKDAVSIQNGKAFIPVMERLGGSNDFLDWKSLGKGTIGFRIESVEGKPLYEGKQSFIYKDTFALDTTLTEGPFINQVKSNSAIISYTTDLAIRTFVLIDDKIFSDVSSCKKHIIPVSNLNPDKKYYYTVKYGIKEEKFNFCTTPVKRSKKEFSFGFIGDSQGSGGGGERNFSGTNYYMMRRIMSAANQYGAKFIQFSGDMIDGYTCSWGEIELEYANWKRSIEPFAHYIPVYTAMGNHETFNYIFRNNKTYEQYWIDRFPFDKMSAEKIFAENSLNFSSNLISEDGTYYDPNDKSIDFPPYDRTVYYYTYGNIAMVVLNTEYFFSPWSESVTSGNVHGYIMDNQLSWLKDVILKLEGDKDIDYIFISHHAPVFPNSGSVGDAMWYNGDNNVRPYVAGKPLKKGIIERRDEYLDIIVNKSKKVVAVLCGHEHNYSLLKISDKMARYPENYAYPKLKLNREIYQITNGGGGARFNGYKEKTPWSDNLIKFSIPPSIAFITVKNKTIKLKVFNPETFELIHEFELLQ